MMRVSFAVAIGVVSILGFRSYAQQPQAAADEIRIDRYCRVFSPGHPTQSSPSPAPHYHYDRVVCHIESSFQTDHWERTHVKGAPKNVHVLVSEREYLLQNTTGHPVSFVVDYPLRKGWRIDSDPDPVEVKGQVATFRVTAAPQQIVRLHVGSRSN